MVQISGTSSVKTAGMASCLYHFQNKSSGCIRTILLADCSSPRLPLLTTAECGQSRHSASDCFENSCDKRWPLTLEDELHNTTLGMGFEKKSNDHSSGGQKAALVPTFAGSFMQSVSCEHVESFESAFDQKQTGRTSAVQISTHEGKLLVCSMSLDTYAPHVIGIKRLQMEKIKDSMSAGEGWVERSDGVQNLPDMHADMAVNHQIDSMDHEINVHGRIVGMALSPDHR